MSHDENRPPRADDTVRPEGDGRRPSWVPVIAVPEEIEATLASGFLENEGIQCVVESRYFSQEPTNLSVLGEFVLFVHEDAVERARSLLKDRLEMAVDDPAAGEESAADEDADPPVESGS